MPTKKEVYNQKKKKTKKETKKSPKKQAKPRAPRKKKTETKVLTQEQEKDLFNVNKLRSEAFVQPQKIFTGGSWLPPKELINDKLNTERDIANKYIEEQRFFFNIQNKSLNEKAEIQEALRKAKREAEDVQRKVFEEQIKKEKEQALLDKKEKEALSILVSNKFKINDLDIIGTYFNENLRGDKLTRAKTLVGIIKDKNYLDAFLTHRKNFVNWMEGADAPVTFPNVGSSSISKGKEKADEIAVLTDEDDPVTDEEVAIPPTPINVGGRKRAEVITTVIGSPEKPTLAQRILTPIKMKLRERGNK